MDRTKVEDVTQAKTIRDLCTNYIPVRSITMFMRLRRFKRAKSCRGHSAVTGARGQAQSPRGEALEAL